MASASITVLPGDNVSPESLPLSSKRELKLGPGLRHLPPSTIKATICGTLSTDARKNAVWVEYSGGRVPQLPWSFMCLDLADANVFIQYIPSVGDQVIVTVQRSTQDFHNCYITPHSSLVLLPSLAFEAATKKTRPVLNQGALVYARVALTSKHTDTELECVNPATGKADGLGPLKRGMLWDISLGFARRMMMGKRGGVVLLEELSKSITFEVAIGRNGKVWVDGGDNVRTTIAVGRAIVEVDEKGLTEQKQVEVAKRIAKSLR